MNNLPLPDNDWYDKLQDELKQPYLLELWQSINHKYATSTVYPPQEKLFSALRLTPYGETKVVILGQDPYHGAGQANGLSFSVQKGIKQPPSLKNIFKELEADVGCPAPQHGSLEQWAQQGVLLLNTVLTVEEGRPASHQGLGWERFTDCIINLLNKREQPLVFILWGKHAEGKAAAIDSERHGVIISPHPSPFAARKGFFGSKPFSRANEFLHERGIKTVDWTIAE